ncbi:radical SAM family heme chaperone HemW [Atopomonas sediminilitoris]|uniref:radical SAM family heme chaperone HemW n=1 Tax=Atopomonas sediminilitoris TaxID=2919919 RepID=UPI001F4E2876|nr:radical SAM family heme chaperone HemW [Atopomonas sediminilitoris]MCJ8170558.1 radical SAM family heme chaperone HemW [Atopomonas sediminilitoris]
MSALFSGLPPLALYIHVPWCVRKCPYCDFNSHAAGEQLPEQAYVEALLADLREELPAAHGRPIRSIFIGGGTPSLFSAAAYQRLFSGVRELIELSPDCEITLEANPGTFEQAKFAAYRELGINRLSLGIQSFAPAQLQALGRIHGRDEALSAASQARAAGFDNFNLDLMHGLPGQTLDEALADLAQAIDLKPTHLSWYQLTIEPNTEYWSKPPRLPEDETLWDIQEHGQALLAQHGYQQYETSAYAQPQREARHNLNYWQFGDFIGIGAGAHGKLSHIHADGTWQIQRRWKTRTPKDYLTASKPFCAGKQVISADELAFEFMMNALRLTQGVPSALYAARCGQTLDTLQVTLNTLRQRGLLVEDEQRLCASAQGQMFLNDLLQAFLPD